MFYYVCHQHKQNKTCSIHAKHGRVRSTVQKHIFPEIKQNALFVMTYGIENDPCTIWCVQTMTGRQHKLAIHINNDVVKATMDMRNMFYRTIILLISSELNVQCINRSVYEFKLQRVMLWMVIKNTYHERNQDNAFRGIVISKNTQNHLVETFRSMPMDAEHNETTPTISFYRFHENAGILTTKKNVKCMSSTT